MTSGAVDDWVWTFQVLDVLQQIVIDGLNHFRHLTRDRFGRFVIFVPLIDDVAMRTVDPE